VTSLVHLLHLTSFRGPHAMTGDRGDHKPHLFLGSAMAVTSRPEETSQSRAQPTDDVRVLADSIFDAERQSLESSPLRRPGATYRLQVHRGFTLDDVTRVVDYLADLGVTDGYLSPYLSARPGSMHGYDVFDYRRINAEIGDQQAHDRLIRKLKERGMGRVLDIVPNHMGIAGLNPFWMDVLELGPQSRHSRFFDIDWTPIEDELDGRVLLPILEDQYGRVLESGKLVLKRDGGQFFLAYYDRFLPIAPRSYATILEHRLDALLGLGEEEDDVQELRSIASSSRSLPASHEIGDASIEHVAFEKEVIKRRLARLINESPRIRAYIDETTATFVGTPGEASSFDPLHTLLEQQVYRLSYWRVASEEINYRRFFDINDLAGLRTEDPRVFEATHSRIFRWIAEGGVTSLRIDHPDGLADPAGYFRRLQERLFLRTCHVRYSAVETPPADWPTVGRLIRNRFRRAIAKRSAPQLARRFPIVVEKILTRDEPIPRDWTIDGTVGYEFLNAVNGLFVDPKSSAAIAATYHDFTGESTDFRAILFDAKRLITRSSLASERNMLAKRLALIASHDRRSRDFTHAELGRVVGSIMATFPVYRTYIQPGRPVSKRDRRVIEFAVARARKRNPTIDESVFTFVQNVLLMEHPEGLSKDEVARRETFAVRFQQTTGPVQAKGLEDTTFYRYVPLVSLNEVGGYPSRYGTEPERFHRKNERRLASWPHSFLATATHDTKRGEDARIRINVLSELPQEWRAAIDRWARWNASCKRESSRGAVPDAREEYLFYQTLIGSWPFAGDTAVVTPEYVERIQEYLVKAAREAKVKTSWIDSDSSHVDALKAFVADVLTGSESKPFLTDFLRFQRHIARVGIVHSLSQTLIKLTSPGVPDIYQGCELWDLSLVDPDNRRPVDFNLRTQLLGELKARVDRGEKRSDLADDLLRNSDSGSIKLYLHWAALGDRRERPGLYEQGRYIPIHAEGPHAERVVAFARELHGQAVITVAPRLVTQMMGPDGEQPPIGSVWDSTSLIIPTELASFAWEDRLTGVPCELRDEQGGKRVSLSQVLAHLPIGLLVGNE
jgi:(1->4)-alpha-D-glucan 1-alpha-D-glucosylmutase